MRYGAAISALLHVGILILIVVGLPGLLRSDRPEIVPISVELVSIEKLSKKPVKKTPPKPKAKKPPPKKPAPPKAAKKPPPPPPAPSPTPPEALKIPEPEPLPPEPVPKPKPPVAKAEPVPKPKPKPKVKPKPPKKVEQKVAAKLPPAPRPKKKPKPPAPKPDAFQSLLKNLAQDRRKAEKAKADAPTKVTRKTEDKPERSALQARMMAASLAQAVNQQITPCWSIPAGVRDVQKISVAVLIRLNPDGSLGAAPKVEDSGRLGRDPSFRAVAESSLRALRNPQCMPLKLPYDQYDLWKEITFVFDPKEALGQ